MKMYRRLPLTMLLALLPALATAHPSGLAQGRASCGREYHTSAKPYVIADSKEAWYLRRIQTCDTPFFWTKFKIEKKKQPLTITVVSPQLERFKDKLQFRAIVFGGTASGLPKLQKDKLPGALQSADLPSIYGHMLESATDNKAICDKIDNHDVMKQYNKFVDGQCVEAMKMADDYKKPVMAGATWNHWWLYGANLHKEPFGGLFAEPGEYYMVSWIENRNDQHEFITGKYEITIAPNTWYGYADEKTMVKAHEQVSTCTCGNNYAMWTEQHLERIGEDPKTDTYAQELPYQTCPAGTGEEMAESHSHSGVWEWAGAFELQAGVEYHWPIFRNPVDAKYPSLYGHNDTDMKLIYVQVTGVSGAVKEAILSAQLEAENKMGLVLAGMDGGSPELPPVPDDGSGMAPEPLAPDNSSDAQDGRVSDAFEGLENGDSLLEGRLFQLNFELSANKTTIKLIPNNDGVYVLFTEHNANEFRATTLYEGTVDGSAIEPGATMNWEGAHSHSHAPQTMCYAAEPKVDIAKVLEFSGTWDVPPGVYNWTLRAERNSSEDAYEYHEPQMLIYATNSNMDDSRRTAEDVLTTAMGVNANADAAKTTVLNAGDTIKASGMAQQLIVDSAALPSTKTTTFKVEVTGARGITLFTQHMPWEFAAIYLTGEDGTKYWPVAARDYVLDDASGAFTPTVIDGASTGKGMPIDMSDPSSLCGPGTKFVPSVGKCMLDCEGGRRGREAHQQACLGAQCAKFGGVGSPTPARGTTPTPTPRLTMTMTLKGNFTNMSAGEKAKLEAALLSKMNAVIYIRSQKKMGEQLIESVTVDTARGIAVATFLPSTTTDAVDLAKGHIREAIDSDDFTITQENDISQSVKVTEVDGEIPTTAPQTEDDKKGISGGVIVAVVVVVVGLVLGAVYYSKKKANPNPHRSFGGDGVAQAGTNQEFANPIANRAYDESSQA